MNFKPKKAAPDNMATIPVHVFENGLVTEKDDFLIKECVTQIVINGKTIETLPALNEHIDLLGAGYLYQISDIQANMLTGGEVDGSDYHLTWPQYNDWGCMCKKIFTHVREQKLLEGETIKLDASNIHRIFDAFIDSSENFRLTGALHGAALFTPQCEKVVFIEDIARTNVIYKMTGYLINHNINTQHIIVLSCRVNTVILNLLHNIGFRTVITRASVTHEACIKARELEITLIGFVKETRFTVFSGVGNVFFRK